MNHKSLYINKLFSALTLMPCFIALPLIGYEIYTKATNGEAIIWNARFMLLVVCAVLGVIAGLGIWMRVKWARIISAVIFITGMVVFLVLFMVYFGKNQANMPTMSLLLLVYGMCICVLLFFNGDTTETALRPHQGVVWEDVLDVEDRD